MHAVTKEEEGEKENKYSYKSVEKYPPLPPKILFSLWNIVLSRLFEIV